MERRSFDVMVLDLMMPGMSGLDVLKELQARNAECEVVVLTGEATVETAVEAMKLGAREFLTKPISLKELDRLVRKAHETGQLRKENRAAQGRASPSATAAGNHRRISTDAGDVSPHCPSWPDRINRFSFKARAEPERNWSPVRYMRPAPWPTNRWWSSTAPHCRRRCWKANCSATRKALSPVRSGMKQGLFEVADGGTLFIDEIGELALGLQAKLLRVLEDGTLRRVGSVKERRVQVRLIAATNRDLSQEVKRKAIPRGPLLPHQRFNDSTSAVAAA